MYTRPPEFVYKKKKYKVPEVLQNGNHKEIEAWRATSELVSNINKPKIDKNS
jgi:tRNA G37 N-methylase TrmD